jgi:hypothetical protein
MDSDHGKTSTSDSRMVMRWPREGHRERSGVSVAALALVVLAACEPDVVLVTPEDCTDGMVIVRPQTRRESL